MAEAPTVERTALWPASCFSLLALVLLGTRFVQGFIFWGGASRRLFYDFHEIGPEMVDHIMTMYCAFPVASQSSHI